jgi:hypothetical protein
MNTRDVVVRIVKPSERPYLPPKPAEPGRPRALDHRLLYCFGLAGLTVLGAGISFGLCHFGFAPHEVVGLVSLPVVIGVVASYAML